MSQLIVRAVCCILLSTISLVGSGVGSTITIEVQNTELVAGGEGYIDVYLTGLGGATLGQFQYEFVVEGVGPGTDTVNFRQVPGVDVQSTSSPSPYVFLGNSDSGFYNSEPDLFDPTHVIGGDILGNLNLDSVDVDGTFLLARLQVQHFGEANRDFTVSLLASTSMFDRDVFIDPDNNYTPSQITAISGTLKIVATPEPATLGLLSLAGTAAFGLYRRKARLVESTV